MIEGRIQTRSWDDKDGTKKYRTEIVADRVQFGPKAGGTGTGASTPGQRSVGDPKKGKSEAPKEEGGIDYPVEEVNPDDIPF